MKSPTCEQVRELLPEWVAGILDEGTVSEVEEHLSSCTECAGEEALVRSLFRSRPKAPEGLEARIRERVREEKGEGAVVSIKTQRRWAPKWAPSVQLSAAALVILSLGVGLLWEGTTPEVTMDPVEIALEEPVPEAWLWDDGVVAGGLVYDGLSDEELEALIEELEG
jgi:anti-sigma factor RsiW